MPYRSIEDPAKLRRVLEATLLVEADLELPALLRLVVHEALSMTGARYGALGVLNEDRSALVEFITVGLEPDEERRIGPRPTGRGVLGLLITDPKPLRLADLGAHPDSYGFPADHPPMTSFLGVPIKVRDEVYGNLYLTNKVGWSEFTSDDVALVGALAIAAGIAIENTRLHQRAHEAAVHDERDRLARDLHDTVIQRLFAVGLSLQSMVGMARRQGDGEPAHGGHLGHRRHDPPDPHHHLRAWPRRIGPGPGRLLSLIEELTLVVGFEVLLSTGPSIRPYPNTS